MASSAGLVVVRQVVQVELVATDGAPWPSGIAAEVVELAGVAVVVPRFMMIAALTRAPATTMAAAMMAMGSHGRAGWDGGKYGGQ